MIQRISFILIGLLVITIYSNPVYAADPLLEWSASTGNILGYKIYYGTSEGNYPFNEDVGNATQYSLGNLPLTEGTTYYFVVRAYDASRESGNSNVTTYIVPKTDDTTPPLPPQSVTAEIENDDIRLTWHASSDSDLSGYKVYHGTSSRDYTFPTTEKGTSSILSGLEKEKLYFFAVTAIDTAGNESGFSSPEISQLIPMSVEGAMLKWIAATGPVKGYKIYYGTSEGNYTENIDVGNVTQYSIGRLSLPEGTTYYFVVRAYDASRESDNSNTAKYSVGVPADTELPTISINSPTSGSSYNSTASSVDVSGAASDNKGVTEVIWSNSTGASGTAAGTDTWNTGEISLVEGSNAITITARDAAGNAATDSLTVTYTIPDTTAPSVSIRSPTIDETLETSNSSINLDGVASDNKGVTQVIWSNSAGANGTAAGTDTWSTGEISLVEGNNIVIVIALDAAGNESTDVISVTYTAPDPTPPSVSINTPTSGTSFETSTSSIWIGGAASDNKKVTQVTWSNSSGGSGTASGTENWMTQGIVLAEGDNIISITARDAAGNETTDTLTVAYTPVDTQAPSLTLSQPTTGGFYFTRSSTVNLAGTASDNVGVKRVTWSNPEVGSGVASGTTNWSASDVGLALWWNTITITAIDDAENETSMELTVFSFGLTF